MVASAVVKDINRMLEFGNLFKIKKVGREGGQPVATPRGVYKYLYIKLYHNNYYI